MTSINTNDPVDHLTCFLAYDAFSNTISVSYMIAFVWFPRGENLGN